MSRNAPLACFQSHASQSFADSLRRLRRGFCAMSLSDEEDVFGGNCSASISPDQTGIC